MPADVCKFCKREARLIKAHIVPRAFYQIDSTRPLVVVDASRRYPYKRSRIGFYDSRLLCAECEALFARIDDYAAKTLLQFEYIRAVELDDELIGYSVPNAHPALLQLFALSVLWRAHASGLNQCKNFTLGNYADSVAKHLRTSPVALNTTLPVAIYLERDPEYRWCTHLPETITLGSVNYALFVASGYRFLTKIDTAPDPTWMKTQYLGSIANDFIGSWHWPEMENWYNSTLKVLRDTALKHGDPWDKKVKLIHCRVAPHCMFICNYNWQLCTALRRILNQSRN